MNTEKFVGTGEIDFRDRHSLTTYDFFSGVLYLSGNHKINLCLCDKS